MIFPILQVTQALNRSFSTSRVATAQLTVRDALNSALDEEMELDEKVCCSYKE